MSINGCAKMARIFVSDELVKEVQQHYPELARLNATDIADYAMRKLVQEALKQSFKDMAEVKQ